MTQEAQIAKKMPRNGSAQKELLHYSSFLKKEKIKNHSNASSVKHDMLVFLVDDDAFFLNALYYYLTDSLSPKIRLKTFSTGEECLKAMDENPDIIVLDYMLSAESSKAMNGLSYLKKINEVSPDTLVVMLSAQDNVDVALETINEGAYDYLSKSETAFIRLKNIIKNITETISENIEQEKAEKVTNRLNFFIILLLILLFIIGQLTE